MFGSFARETHQPKVGNCWYCLHEDGALVATPAHEGNRWVCVTHASILVG